MARPRIPLADQAGRMLKALATATGSHALSAIDGETLLGERAMLGGFRIGGRVSPGGGCRLFDAGGDVVALNLARADDRDLLPALFVSDALDPRDDADIAAHVARCEAVELVARGREMGLAIAHEGEGGRGAAVRLTVASPAKPERRAPRVLDLSALWAGPLAGHLLGLAGADVTKAESATRPDAMRADETGFFALLNGSKVQKTFYGPESLLMLIAEADIVIEAARPRALLQFGVDADAIVRQRPGLVWLSITAHGSKGEAADWVGFGDDIGVAAGLSAALRAAAGESGFVGDAIADPLSGIRAALVGWQAWRNGGGGRYVLSMRDVVTECLAEASDLDATLRAWRAADGAPFPKVTRRC